MDLKNWPVFSLVDDELVFTIKLACVFGIYGHEVIFVTQSDDVYGMGPNSSGCLGTGDSSGRMYPVKIPTLCGKKIIGFSFGAGPHVLAFTERGDLYTWGHNGYCELGNGAGTQSLQPILIQNVLVGKKVIEVACGTHHSLALTADGEVFAWGQNSSGQVGAGLSATNQSSPKLVSMGIGGKIVKTIACAQMSSFAVLDTGEVYGWGYNGTGQLGVGNNTHQLSPLKISSLSGAIVTKIACGSSHTLALTDEGNLYAWGSNSFGQLGNGNKTSTSTAIKVAKNIERITDIATVHYTNTSAAISLKFKVYMWGQCKGHSVTDPLETKLNSLHDVFSSFSTPNVTYRPLELYFVDGLTVTDTIRNAFDDSSTSDLTLMVQNQPIKVHKAILKLRCEHFRSMFQTHWQENNVDVLEIEVHSFPVYKAFLKYLYTDEVDLTPEAAIELLDLANAYCEKKLKHKCEEMIKHGITVENAAMLYSTAITFQAKDLEDFCFKFSLNHMTAVVQSAGFSALDESTVKNFILKASRMGAFKS